MTAPTHVAFVAACYLGVTAAMRYPVDVLHLAVLSAASALPDIDHPRSRVGQIFFFVSGRIEKRFGHRTITHSALGCVLLAVISFPLVFISGEIYCLFLLGYISHIWLDMWTKNGVLFFWPLRKYMFVIPGRKAWRIEVGSGAERVALVLFLVASGVLYQFQGIGVYRMLHLITKDIAQAQGDFIKYSSTHFTTLKGRFRDNTTLQVKEAEYTVVAVYRDGLMVLNDSHLKWVSKSDHAHLYPLSSVIELKGPMKAISSRINLDGKTVADLIQNVDRDIEHYILGEAIPVSRPPKVPDQSDTLSPLFMSGERIRFYYSTVRDLEPFSSLLLKQGEAIIQYRLKPYEEPPSLNDADPPAAEIIETPLLISVSDLSMIRVKMGDEIEKGDLIADDPTVQDRIDIEYAELKNRESSFISQKANLVTEIADLKITEGFPGHREKIKALEQELKIKEEAYEANKKKVAAEVNLLKQKMRIESPVSGKVGSIRLISFSEDKANVEMLIVSKNPFPKDSRESKNSWESRVESRKTKDQRLTTDSFISEKCTVAKVVDGDTFDCRFGWFKIERVRLIGVGTPETKHPNKPVEHFGKEASRFTSYILYGKEVGLEYDAQRQDDYGRTLAYVYLQDGRMFNALLVQEGYAKASPFPPNVRYKGLFAELQREARENEKGLWGR